MERAAKPTEQLMPSMYKTHVVDIQIYDRSAPQPQIMLD